MRHQCRWQALPHRIRFFIGALLLSLTILLFLSLVDSHYQRCLISISVSQSNFVYEISANTTSSNLYHPITREELLPPDGDETFEKIFKERREVAADQCQSMYGHRPGQPYPLLKVEKSQLNFLLVNDKRKILFCSVPKVASTSWRKFFVQLELNRTTLPFTHDSLHEVETILPFLRPLGFNSIDEPFEKMLGKAQNYKKVMWVREPLPRLYSAWRSKFAVKNDHYWKNVGPKIIKSIRHEDVNVSSIEQGPLVTFEEFLRFIANPPLNTFDDVHWTEMHKLCLTCFIDYDYIGHLEGGENEVNYVIGKVTGQHFIKLPREELVISNETVESSTSPFKTIPNQLIASLYKKYAKDYNVFDYPLPDYGKPKS